MQNSAFNFLGTSLWQGLQCPSICCYAFLQFSVAKLMVQILLLTHDILPNSEDTSSGLLLAISLLLTLLLWLTTAVIGSPAERW